MQKNCLVCDAQSCSVLALWVACICRVILNSHLPWPRRHVTGKFCYSLENLTDLAICIIIVLYSFSVVRWAKTRHEISAHIFILNQLKPLSVLDIHFTRISYLALNLYRTRNSSLNITLNNSGFKSHFDLSFEPTPN